LELSQLKVCYLFYKDFAFLDGVLPYITPILPQDNIESVINENRHNSI